MAQAIVDLIESTEPILGEARKVAKACCRILAPWPEWADPTTLGEWVDSWGMRAFRVCRWTGQQYSDFRVPGSYIATLEVTDPYRKTVMKQRTSESGGKYYEKTTEMRPGARGPWFSDEDAAEIARTEFQRLQFFVRHERGILQAHRETSTAVAANAKRIQGRVGNAAAVAV